MRKGVIDTSEGGYLYLSAVVVDRSRGLLSIKDAGSVYLFYAGVSVAVSMNSVQLKKCGLLQSS